MSTTVAECHAGVSDLDANGRCPEFTLADVFLLNIYIYLYRVYIWFDEDYFKNN